MDCAGAAAATPKRLSASAALSWRPSKSSAWKKLIKPGPAISALLMLSSAGRAAIRAAAKSRGFFCAGLASIIAKRSEERRVGKEGSSRGLGDDVIKWL